MNAPAQIEAVEELPCNAELEQIVLGGLILHPEWQDDMPWLGAQHFHWRAHVEIFSTWFDLRLRGQDPHPLRISGALKDSEAFAELGIGAPTYVNDLVIEFDRNRAWVRRSAREIVRLAKQREIIFAAQATAEDALSLPASDSIEELQGRAIEALERVDGLDVERETSVGSAASAALRHAFSPEKAADGTVMTGLVKVDDRMGGIRPGEMVVVAGRPGMGKSLFGQRVARTAAEQGYWVLFVQLEMGEEQMAARFITDVVRDQGQRVFYSNFRKGTVLPSFAPALASADEILQNWPLFIEPTPGLTMAQIGVKARQVRKEARKMGRKLGLVVIDHMGLVAPSQTYKGNKVAEITEISNACKRLAKELECGVLALCQLNRAVESRDDKRPVLSDLRESGSIEQDADAVLLLYREAYYVKQKQATMAPADYAITMRDCEFVLEANCAKVRDGDPGLDVVACDAATASIRDAGAFD